MKKAKMMLTGIAVLAVVGGALAFKANSAFTQEYCTTVTDNFAGICPNLTTGRFTEINPGGHAVPVYYTTATGLCDENTTCPTVSAFLTTDVIGGK